MLRASISTGSSSVSVTVNYRTICPSSNNLNNIDKVLMTYAVLNTDGVRINKLYHRVQNVKSTKPVCKINRNVSQKHFIGTRHRM